MPLSLIQMYYSLSDVQMALEEQSSLGNIAYGLCVTFPIYVSEGTNTYIAYRYIYYILIFANYSASSCSKILSFVNSQLTYGLCSSGAEAL